MESVNTNNNDDHGGVVSQGNIVNGEQDNYNNNNDDSKTISMQVMVLAGRRIKTSLPYVVKTVWRRSSWPKKVLHVGKTSPSSPGIDPVWNEEVTEVCTDSFFGTHVDLLVQDSQGHMLYSWSYPLSDASPIAGWIALTPADATGAQGQEISLASSSPPPPSSSSTTSSSSSLPAELNISLTFSYKISSFPRSLLSRWISPLSLRTPEAQRLLHEKPHLVVPDNATLDRYFSSFFPSTRNYSSWYALRLLTLLLLIASLYVVPGVVVFGFRFS